MRSEFDKDSVILWLRFCVFLDFLGVAIVVPLFSAYFREAGINNEMYGYISSMYYLSQLIGGGISIYIIIFYR